MRTVALAHGQPAPSTDGTDRDTAGQSDVDRVIDGSIRASVVGASAAIVAFGVTALLGALTYLVSGVVPAVIVTLATAAALLVGTLLAVALVTVREIRQKHLSDGRPSVDDMSVRDLELLELYSRTEGVL